MRSSFNDLIVKIKITVDGIAKKGFFHLLSSNILLKISGFGSQLFLIHLLTATELGQIRTIQTFVEISMIFATFGFSTVILKQCSEDRPLNERSAIFRRNSMYTLASTAITMIVMMILSQLNLLSPDENINELLFWFMLTLPTAVLVNLLLSYLQSIKQVKKIAMAQIVQRLVGITLIILFAWLYGIKGFVAGSVLAGYIFLPLFIKYVRKFVLFESVLSSKLPDKVVSMKLAGWSFLALITHRLSETIGILMLNFMILDREGFGYYSIATIFLIPLREIVMSIRTISIPYLSEKQNDKAEFIRVLNKYRKMMLLQALGLIIASWIFVPIIVRLFFGEEYTDVSKYFLILVIGHLFHSYMALLPTALISLGEMRYNFYAAISYLPLSLLINYFMIKEYGLFGAAYAQVITSFIIMLVIIFYSNRGIKEFYKSY